MENLKEMLIITSLKQKELEIQNKLFFMEVLGFLRLNKPKKLITTQTVFDFIKGGDLKIREDIEENIFDIISMALFLYNKEINIKLYLIRWYNIKLLINTLKRAEEHIFLETLKMVNEIRFTTIDEYNNILSKNLRFTQRFIYC